MVRSIEQISISYQGLIDSLLTQQASQEVQFKKRHDAITESVQNNPNIKYLRLSSEISEFAAATVQMILVHHSLIKNLKSYVDSILESLDETELETAEYQKRISELEDMNEGHIRKRDRLEEDLRKLQERFGAVPSKEGEQRTIEGSEAENKEEGYVCANCKDEFSAEEMATIPTGKSAGQIGTMCKGCYAKYREELASFRQPKVEEEKNFGQDFEEGDENELHD